MLPHCSHQGALSRPALEVQPADGVPLHHRQAHLQSQRQSEISTGPSRCSQAARMSRAACACLVAEQVPDVVNAVQDHGWPACQCTRSESRANDKHAHLLLGMRCTGGMHSTRASQLCAAPFQAEAPGDDVYILWQAHGPQHLWPEHAAVAHLQQQVSGLILVPLEATAAGVHIA